MKKTLLISMSILLVSACAQESYNFTEPQASVSSIDIQRQQEGALISLSGEYKNGCETVEEVFSVQKGSTLYVDLPIVSEGDLCTQALVPFIHNVPITEEELESIEWIESSSLKKALKVEEL